MIYLFTIIDLPAVIQAVNKKRRVDAGVPRKPKTEAADEIGAKLNSNLMKLVSWIEAQANAL